MIAEPIKRIANGARVEVEFPFYRGIAGCRSDGREIAFFAPVRAAYAGAEGRVDGVAVRVLAAAASGVATGMAVLTIEPITTA